MADIQGIITLGTGPTTGSDIEHFILVGLNANPSLVITDQPSFSRDIRPFAFRVAGAHRTIRPSTRFIK